jgi:hypothetical protein
LAFFVGLLIFEDLKYQFYVELIYTCFYSLFLIT